MGKLKVKHGTFNNYMALPSKDADTLYFITDRGLVYKGLTLVTDKIRVEQTGSDDQQVLTITDYSTSTPSVYTVRSSAAITAIVTSIEGTMSTHRMVSSGVNADGKATDANFGHVELSDATNGTEAAASGGTAATPKAVKDALDAAKDYTDAAIGGLTGAMILKGTIGAAADNPTVTSLPTSGYASGWTYIVITAGTYAGKSCAVNDRIIAINDGPASGSTVIDNDWIVSNLNTEGMVTSDETLEVNTIALGNGNKTLKKLSAGTNGYWLRQTANGPAWVALTNLMYGQGYGTCSTQAATLAKVGTLSGFELSTGAMFSLKFTYANTKASATLNVNSTGAKAIYWRGAAITADYVIESGDTVTFIYDGTRYHIVSIDRPIDTALSSTSRNAVRNSAIYTALQGKQGTLTAGDGVLIGTVNNVDDTVHLDYGAVSSENTNKPVTGASVYSAIGESALAWEEITTTV